MSGFEIIGLVLGIVPLIVGTLLPDRHHRLTIDKVNTIPIDYLSLANRMSESPNIGLFRRFGDLNTLTLLRMQAELEALETQYLELREEDSKSNCPKTRSYAWNMAALHASEGMGGSKQRDLLIEIEGKLKAYNEALARQIQSHAQPSPGSSDIRGIRELTRFWGEEENAHASAVVQDQAGHIFRSAAFMSAEARFQDAITKILGAGVKENVWRKGVSPEDERKRLEDLVVLSPISAARNPISASRADRGLVYRLERPFRQVWAFLSLWVQLALYVVKEFWGVLNKTKESDVEDPITDTAELHAHMSNPTPESGSSATAAPAQPRRKTVRFGTPDPVISPSIQQSSASDIIDQAPRATMEEVDNEKTESQNVSNSDESPTIDIRAANIADPDSPIDFPATASLDPTSNTMPTPSRQPMQPRAIQGPINLSNPEVNDRIIRKIDAREEDAAYLRELQRLDATHKPDLKSSILSAILTTIPILVLYYIKNLTWRVVALVMFTTVFAVGLTVSYRPKRGEVFATTAAFAAVQVVFIGSSQI